MGARERALTKGTRYIAEQALTDLFDGYLNRSMEGPDQSFGQWAVTHVFDVEYKPVSERLLIVLDLGATMNAPEPAHDPDAPFCAAISNGVGCSRYAAHDGGHHFDRDPAND